MGCSMYRDKTCEGWKGEPIQTLLTIYFTWVLTPHRNDHLLPPTQEIKTEDFVNSIDNMKHEMKEIEEKN
jgi:hypothetical protein